MENIFFSLYKLLVLYFLWPNMRKDLNTHFPHLFGPKLSTASKNFWKCLWSRWVLKLSMWVLKLSVLKRTNTRLFIHRCPKLVRHIPYHIQWWYMMISPYWCIDDIWWSDHNDVKKASSKTTVTHCVQKRHHCTQNWHVISPIPDTMMIYDDLTIMM